MVKVVLNQDWREFKRNETIEVTSAVADEIRRTGIGRVTRSGSVGQRRNKMVTPSLPISYETKSAVDQSVATEEPEEEIEEEEEAEAEEKRLKRTKKV